MQARCQERVALQAAALRLAAHEALDWQKQLDEAARLEHLVPRSELARGAPVWGFPHDTG